MFDEVVAIYHRAKTYVMRYNLPDEFVCEMIWPETQSDFDFLVTNVVRFYGISMDDVANLRYEQDDATDASLEPTLDKFLWFSGMQGPYMPNSLNFTKYNQHSIGGRHCDEMECKINIPVVNMGQACMHFTASDERCWYPSPVLLNVGVEHEVEGLERLRQFDLVERAFLQIVLKKPYQYYSDTLPRPNGW